MWHHICKVLGRVTDYHDNDDFITCLTFTIFSNLSQSAVLYRVLPYWQNVRKESSLAFRIEESIAAPNQMLKIQTFALECFRPVLMNKLRPGSDEALKNRRSQLFFQVLFIHRLEFLTGSLQHGWQIPNVWLKSINMVLILSYTRYIAHALWHNRTELNRVLDQSRIEWTLVHKQISGGVIRTVRSLFLYFRVL